MRLARLEVDRMTRALCHGVLVIFLAAGLVANWQGVASAAPSVRAPTRASTPKATVLQQVKSRHTTPAKRRAAAKDSKRIGLRAALRTAKENFQIYRGDRLERWVNRIKVGRSDFKSKLSVKQNLRELVRAKGMEHYYAKVDGRDVLHLVVNLGQGKATKAALRSVMRRVGNETVELNYKAATAKNVYGHVAVRVGNGALYDLTGTQGVATLPKFMERTLSFIRGKSTLTFARKRNLRRFMESRKDSPNASASVYYGMLFAASPKEVKATQAIYNKRLKEATTFNVSGGDAKKGEYSCAQFLTENVPFFNSRGVGASVGAKSTTSAAQKSLKLEAVIVYKMPSVETKDLKAYP